jgi:hypothetical protein
MFHVYVQKLMRWKESEKILTLAWELNKARVGNLLSIHIRVVLLRPFLLVARKTCLWGKYGFLETNI